MSFRIGATLEPSQIAEPAYAETLAREFNSLTAENAMKWYSIQPSRDRFEFGGADAVLAFADANDLQVRGHALVWAQDQFTPDWVRAIDDPDELRQVLRTYLRTVLERYRGRIRRWDVVNEPLEPLGGRPSDSVFQRVLGPDWIIEVYRYAHEIDPDVELWINEHAMEDIPAKHAGLLDLAGRLLDAGVPLHGIGMQTHRPLEINPGPAVFERLMRDYANLGLKVAVTELDVAALTFLPGHLERQAEIYRTVVSACLAVPACEEVTTWGVTDRDSWLNAAYPWPPQPLMFDEQFIGKPAHRAVAEALDSARRSGRH